MVTYDPCKSSQPVSVHAHTHVGEQHHSNYLPKCLLPCRPLSPCLQQQPCRTRTSHYHRRYHHHQLQTKLGTHLQRDQNLSFHPLAKSRTRMRYSPLASVSDLISTGLHKRLNEPLHNGSTILRSGNWRRRDELHQGGWIATSAFSSPQVCPHRHTYCPIAKIRPMSAMTLTPLRIAKPNRIPKVRN